MVPHIDPNIFPQSLKGFIHSSFFEKGRQLLDVVVMQGVASKDFHNCLKEKIPWL
jgi:hypothetical protein